MNRSFKIYFALILLVVGLTACAGMAKKETVEIRGQFWVLPLKNGYVSTMSDGVHDIYKSGSTGALQLSSYVKNGGFPKSELENIALSQIKGRSILVDVSHDDIAGYKSTFRESGVYWTYWFISIKNTLIFVTYNVDIPKLNDEELKLVESLVSGISST